MIRRALRRAGLAAAGLSALCALLFFASELRLLRSYRCAPWPSAGLEASGGDAARGRALAQGVALCAFCHGPELAGRMVVDDPWIGRLYAPNLHPGAGSVVAGASDAELERAIRRGVGRDGRSLWVMPSEHLRSLSDAEVAALIAYLRALAPVDSPAPPRRMGPLSRLVLVAGLAPELLSAERAGCVLPERGMRAERESRGSALVEIGGCRVCHRADLRGGLHPLSLEGEPPPPDLTPSGPLARWSRDEFARAMRTGVSPEGRALDPRYMPWPSYAALGDPELDAIWRYLRSLDTEKAAATRAPERDAG